MRVGWSSWCIRIQIHGLPLKGINHLAGLKFSRKYNSGIKTGPTSASFAVFFTLSFFKPNLDEHLKKKIKWRMHHQWIEIKQMTGWMLVNKIKRALINALLVFNSTSSMNKAALKKAWRALIRWYIFKSYLWKRSIYEHIYAALKKMLPKLNIDNC